MRKQKGDKSAFINGRKGSFGVKRPVGFSGGPFRKPNDTWLNERKMSFGNEGLQLFTPCTHEFSLFTLFYFGLEYLETILFF